MRFAPKALMFIFLASLLLLMSGRIDAQQRPTLVEVWCGGDDGLTLRLRDATEHAFSSSPDFQMSSGKLAGTLIVMIPTHVGWKIVGKRTRVFYKIELSIVKGKNFGEKAGTCLDDDLDRCVASIVRFSRTALRNNGIK